MHKTLEGKTVIFAWVFIVLASLLVFPGRTGITGFAVYQGGIEGYSFVLSSLTYNETAVNVSGNELKLNSITEIRSYDTMETEDIDVWLAYEGVKNKTAQVQNIDGNIAEISKNKMFNVVFEDNVTNDYKIQLYLLASDASEIYLCDLLQNCDSPGYGTVNYDGGTGYYNITISGIQEQVRGFNIDPPANIDFDYMRALYEYNLIHYYNISYYPLQAVVETDDFAPQSLYSWNNVVVEEFNGQTIEYYYSTDSGETWNYAENKDISNADIAPGKIRLRVLLTSDSAETPVIRNLTVTYSEKITCDPDWQPEANPCLDDDSRLVSYADVNYCNTTEELPESNGTCIYCDYCTPEWQETNTTCLIDDTINQYFADINSCFAQTNLSSDNSPPGNNTYACDYCTQNITGYNTSCSGQETFTAYYMDNNDCYEATGLVSDIVPANSTYDCIYNTSNSTQPENMTNATGQDSATGDSLFEVEIENNETMTVVRVGATVNFTNESISLKNVELETVTTLASLRDINITINSSIKENISTFSLRFNYNSTMLQESDVNESTLAIYYYDEEYDELEGMPSTINRTGKYVEANITHLSIYGLYGEKNLPEESADGERSGAEEGGSGRIEESRSRGPERREEQMYMPALPEEGMIEEPSEEEEAQAEDEITAAEEVSLGSAKEYETEETEEDMALRKIGEAINSNIRDKYNISMAGIFIVMITITYILAEMRARKGYIK